MIKLTKKIILGILINIISIWAAAQVLPGFSYSHQEYILPSAALALVFLDRIIKPFLKLIFLPINLLTLGLFSWVVSALVVYLLSVVIDEITITPFTFAGLNKAGFVIPSVELNLLVVTILAAFVIRFVNGFLYWLIK